MLGFCYMRSLRVDVWKSKDSMLDNQRYSDVLKSYESELEKNDRRINWEEGYELRLSNRVESYPVLVKYEDWFVMIKKLRS